METTAVKYISKNIKLLDITAFFSNYIIEIKGKVDNIIVSNINASEKVNEYSLDWINPLKLNKQEIAEQTKAKAIICDNSVMYSNKLIKDDKVLIHVKNPKLIIALIADHFFLEKPSIGIHCSAIIHPEAKISPSVFIGANCSIGKCKIEDGSQIYPNVTIYDNVTIKNNVIIQAGAVIGTDGLGCERKEDGSLVKFPHFGGVVIEENVEIGANCQIAKGALSDTVIGYGSKINVGCYIAHNVVLGRNVWISAQAKIAGSVKVGDNATIFVGVIIREQRTIGKGATIGMGAVVTKDVPAGETWVGNPAKKLIK